MKTYVLYHGNCPDGTGAALAAYLKLGDFAGINGASFPVEYLPVNYGQPPPPIEDGSNVFIVDFSYARAVLEDLGCNKRNQLVVLDHHATAQRDLEGLPGCHFDMTKSGAVLAWEYFHPNKQVPKLILYLQDRDLWQFKLPASREVSAAIGSYPFDFRLWRNWILDWSNQQENEDCLFTFIDEGKTCLRLKKQQVENMAKHSRMAVFNMNDTPQIIFNANLSAAVGHTDNCYVVPVVNATCFFSEVGEKLLELFPESPFAVYYMDRNDGKRQWGIRSRKTFDASVIAKAFGGGGHPQACGFVQQL